MSKKADSLEKGKEEADQVYIIYRDDGKWRLTDDIEKANYYRLQGYAVMGIPKVMAHEQELINERDN